MSNATGNIVSHTPGPWAVVQKCDDSLCDIATEVGTLRQWNVASVNKLRDEYRANARLIAAAPDMKEALRVLVLDVECYCADHVPVVAPCGACIAKTALEKAGVL
jgi:hypothetical protein